jgi:hypothetical protein
MRCWRVSWGNVAESTTADPRAERDTLCSEVGSFNVGHLGVLALPQLEHPLALLLQFFQLTLEALVDFVGDACQLLLFLGHRIVDAVLKIGFAVALDLLNQDPLRVKLPHHARDRQGRTSFDTGGQLFACVRLWHPSSGAVSPRRRLFPRDRSPVRAAVASVMGHLQTFAPCREDAAGGAGH